jgi:hypothetical protein
MATISNHTISDSGGKIKHFPGSSDICQIHTGFSLPFFALSYDPETPLWGRKDQGI